MPLTIIRQDITKLDTDAIVNAANVSLRQGGGVCGAIYRAAGTREMGAACAALAPIACGEAVVTPGFDLPAKFVIHAAGPVYDQHPPEVSEALLRAAYQNALKRALEQGCESIAFPLISSGVYGYPKQEALRVATQTIEAFLEQHDLSVYLAVFDKEAYEHSRALAGAVQSYIDEHYVRQRLDREWEMRRRRFEREYEQRDTYEVSYQMFPTVRGPQPFAPARALDDMLDQLDISFSEAVLRLIDEKGMKDVDVYKRANLTRQVFSKLRSGKGYTPSKRTALALAIGLRLTLAETQRLLAHAGYALSHSNKGDVIVEYYLINGRYDIFDLNEMLDRHDQLPLGG